MPDENWVLTAGDILAIVLVTVVGFATHGEAGLSFIPRMLAAIIPLSIVWFLLAPWFGLFQSEITFNPRQIWRPAFVMLYAGPLAVLLRGLILNTPILPIFAVVFSGTSALGIMFWRGIYYLLKRK
jgi:hypothetical protein